MTMNIKERIEKARNEAGIYNEAITPKVLSIINTASHWARETERSGKKFVDALNRANVPDSRSLMNAVNNLAAHAGDAHLICDRLLKQNK